MGICYSFILILFLCTFTATAQEARNYDGSMNNLGNPDWGQAGGVIMRMTSNGYGDGVSSMGGTTRPNPRYISNMLFDQQESLPNALGITDFGWAFGQFIDHDITLVDDHPTEHIEIPVPMGDPFFDPMETGTQMIPMRRSKYDSGTGLGEGNPRMHINDITSWIDGSNVYGSDEARAMWLRTGTGGRLKVSEDNLLPFNTVTGLFADAVDADAPFMLMEGPPVERHFIAGDVRANEQPILSALHTLFVREHNRLCDELAADHPTWTDEQLYQHARRMNVGFIQAIAFEEWLPALGVDLAPYAGYNGAMMPNIMNVFSAAAFRLGHTLINDALRRIDLQGNEMPTLSLRDGFFNPMILKDEGGVEPLFLGMADQRQQTFDAKVVGDLRNFLFGPPGAGGLDLAAININRGRERGLADYNTLRADMGLPRQTHFYEITSDPEVKAILQVLYGTVDNIDPWVGMLAEDHVPGTAIGETVRTILTHQFTHLRDGDRFYYENDPDLPSAEIEAIRTTTLADLIRRNTEAQVQDAVFFIDTGTAIASNTPERFDGMDVDLYPNPVRSTYNLRIDAARPEAVEMRL
ncbi:MAG TPA: peroxidase family protein, partial [Rhodothermales bacterium]|nr:peroxidase family protein [Rhodothermales bacterium]